MSQDLRRSASDPLSSREAKRTGVPSGKPSERTPLVRKPTVLTFEFSKENLIKAAAIVLVLMGMLFLVFHMGFSPVTAMYVIIQILTTVGYGDFTVRENCNWCKLGMAFYALCVLIFLAFYVNAISTKVFDAQAQAIRHRIRLRRHHDDEDGAQKEIERRMASSAMYEMLEASLIFWGFVLFGTIFYGTYEACTCSYGASLVHGCDESSYETCARTGGFTKTYFEAFYMSVITLTTIGFGDHTPRSYVGRAIGCVWIVLGVVATARFVDKISQVLHTKDQQQIVNYQEGMSEETFKKVDTNDNGGLCRSEFLKYTLLQYGVVDEDFIKDIDDLFDKLDVKHDNNVTLDMINRSHVSAAEQRELSSSAP